MSRLCHLGRPREQVVSTNKNLKMEIDGGTIVVSIIFAALLAVPFVLDYRRRKQKGE
ncbi:MAG: hypothetical protein IPO87_05570 [Flavobacteriales bacterium]|nr:hypothetical protein [Flavobacteriales bacterium]